MTNLSSLDEALLWRFDAHSVIDKPFHVLVAVLGTDAVVTLDELILQDPVSAAKSAVMFYQDKVQIANIDPYLAAETSRALMEGLRDALKNESLNISKTALLPEQSVYPPLNLNSHLV